MRYRLLNLIIVLVGCFIFDNNNVTHADESWQEIIDQLVQPYIKSEMIVGVSIGIIKDDRREDFSYGRTNDQNPGIGDSRTLYEIGSLSKVFTGILLADAVSRGQVSLDDTWAELSVVAGAVPHPSQSTITLKHLATHTSGLPRMPGNFQPVDSNNPYADYTSEKLFEFLSHYEMTHQPGDKWQYSNLGFGLLGQLLAAKQGVSYQQLLNDRIASLLGMADTTVQVTQENKARLAAPYTEAGLPTGSWDFQVMAGAGAVRSTIDDLLSFAQAHLNPPANELGTAIALAYQQHQRPLSPDSFATGLGWLVARDGETRFHNGQTGGYHSAMFINRRMRQAVVVLANTATADVDSLTEDIFRVLAGLEAVKRDFSEFVDVSTEAMQLLVGRYQLLGEVFFTVEMVEGRLMVRLTGQPAFRVYPKSETQWVYRAVPASLTFDIGPDGNCSRLILHQNGISQTASRVP
jgi:D-alanyl-D-alanine-carboxypeptidase/D-alanyl-D-alanine-endopeptidase